MKKILEKFCYSLFFISIVLGGGYLQWQFMEWFDDYFDFGTSLILMLSIGTIVLSWTFATCVYNEKHKNQKRIEDVGASKRELLNKQ